MGCKQQPGKFAANAIDAGLLQVNCTYRFAARDALTESAIIHCVPKKTCDYIFYNNFNTRCPITIIFGIVSSKSMCHRMMVSFPTSPI